MPSSAKPETSAVEFKFLFSFKIIFFRQRFRRVHEAPRGATRAQNCLMKRQGGERYCSRGCAVVPANLAGLFRLLPSVRKGRKQTQPVPRKGKAVSRPKRPWRRIWGYSPESATQIIVQRKKRIPSKWWTEAPSSLFP